MKIITKYMLKSLIPNYLVSLAVFVSLMIVNQIFILIKYIVEKDIPASNVSRLFIYSLPGILGFTVPMVVVVGVILTFGRMSADSEVVALRGSGISLMRIIQPTIFFGIVLSVFTFLFYDSVLPSGNRAYIRMRRLVMIRDPLADFDARQIIKIGSNSVRFDKQDKKTGMMYNIYITSSKGSVTYAKKGLFIDKQLVGNKLLFRFQLYDVTTQNVDKKNPDRFIQTFSPLVIQTFIERNTSYSKAVHHPKTLTATQLIKRIDQHSKQYDSRLKREYKTLENTYKSRISFNKKLESIKVKVAQEKIAMRPTRLDLLLELMKNIGKRRLNIIQTYKLWSLNNLLKRDYLRGLLLKMQWAVSADYEIIKIDKLWHKKKKVGHWQVQLDRMQRIVKGKNKALTRAKASINRVKLQRAKRLGLDRYELQRKVSMPVACLIFTLIGAPLGMFARRSGKSSGFGIGFVIMLLYYILMTVLKGSVISGALNPIVAAWFPNVLTGLIGTILIYKKMVE